MIGDACRTGGCTGAVEHKDPRAVRCERCRAIILSGGWAARAIGPKGRRISNSTRLVRSEHREQVRHVAAHIGRKPEFIQCEVCCDMPWARFPGKRTALTACAPPSGYRCKGCGEEYAPEPPPEPISLIRSSSAFTAETGELYGVSFVKNGCGEYQSAKNREYKAKSLAKKAERIRFLASGADWDEESK